MQYIARCTGQLAAIGSSGATAMPCTNSETLHSKAQASQTAVLVHDYQEVSQTVTAVYIYTV
jgi:hypothetical protein